MRPPKLVLVATLVATAAAVLLGSQLGGIRPAGASATHRYVLRKGDRITIPAIDQTCIVSGEAGAPGLFCARSRRPHHQIVFFRDSILAWKVGNANQPVWRGRP